MITSEDGLDALTTTLMWFFENGYAPTRRDIIVRLEKEFPQLVFPRQDTEVAVLLNGLVDRGVLRRLTPSPSKRVYVPEVSRTILQAKGYLIKDNKNGTSKES